MQRVMWLSRDWSPAGNERPASWPFLSGLGFEIWLKALIDGALDYTSFPCILSTSCGQTAAIVQPMQIGWKTWLWPACWGLFDHFLCSLQTLVALLWRVIHTVAKSTVVEGFRSAEYSCPKWVVDFCLDHETVGSCLAANVGVIYLPTVALKAPGCINEKASISQQVRDTGWVTLGIYICQKTFRLCKDRLHFPFVFLLFCSFCTLFWDLVCGQGIRHVYIFAFPDLFA